MNLNDISVDTDLGSLLSATDDEVRRCMGSESDTTTPTFEDWRGVAERRLSMERINELNKTPTNLQSNDEMNGKLNNSFSDAGFVPMLHDNSDSHYRYPMPHATVYTGPSSKIHDSTMLTLSKSSNFKQECKTEEGTGPISEGIPEDMMSDVEGKVKEYLHEVMGLMRQVHQDLRFALPSMVERAAIAYLRDKKSLTLTELICDEYADEKLERFMVRMLSEDKALMMIFTPEFRGQKDTVIHLRYFMRNEEGSSDCTDAHCPPKLKSIEQINFYKPADIPQFIENAAEDVTMPYNGSFAIVLSQLTNQVESQLDDLCKLDIDHLSLSNANNLKKGTPVVLKSDINTYCRGLVEEEWIRNEKNSYVKCLLIDYGGPQDIPIEVVYSFPKWTDSIIPALVIHAKLDAYPKGARNKTQEFSLSDWDAIEIVLNEWKKTIFDLKIVATAENEFAIDMKNENGELFTEYLVEKGLVQKGLICAETASCVSSIPPLPSDSHPLQSSLPSLLSIPFPQSIKSPVQSSPLTSVCCSNGENDISQVLEAVPSTLVCVNRGMTPSNMSAISSNSFQSLSTNIPFDAPVFGTGSNNVPSPVRNEASSDDKKNAGINSRENVTVPIINTKEADSGNKRERALENLVTVKNACPTISTSMHVLNEICDNATPAALVVEKIEPIRRTLIEAPSTIPSLLKIVPQERVETMSLLPPLVMESKMKRPLVQILNDDE